MHIVWVPRDRDSGQSIRLLLPVCTRLQHVKSRGTRARIKVHARRILLGNASTSLPRSTSLRFSPVLLARQPSASAARYAKDRYDFPAVIGYRGKQRRVDGHPGARVRSTDKYLFIISTRSTHGRQRRVDLPGGQPIFWANSEQQGEELSVQLRAHIIYNTHTHALRAPWCKANTHKITRSAASRNRGPREVFLAKTEVGGRSGRVDVYRRRIDIVYRFALRSLPPPIDNLTNADSWHQGTIVR